MSYTELSTKEVKATRKDHKCEWCATKIEAGSSASHRTYIWEGDFHSEYMHPECKRAMAHAPHEEIMEGWCPGDYPRGGWHNVNATE